MDVSFRSLFFELYDGKFRAKRGNGDVHSDGPEGGSVGRRRTEGHYPFSLKSNRRESFTNINHGLSKNLARDLGR